MKHIANFLKSGANHLSYCTKSIITVAARLFGIRIQKDGEYDSKQLASAVWIFILGTVTGLFIFGIDFPIMIWAIVVFSMLTLVNLDEALMLTALYAEQRK